MIEDNTIRPGQVDSGQMSMQREGLWRTNSPEERLDYQQLQQQGCNVPKLWYRKRCRVHVLRIVWKSIAHGELPQLWQ